MHKAIKPKRTTGTRIPAIMPARFIFVAELGSVTLTLLTKGFVQVQLEGGGGGGGGGINFIISTLPHRSLKTACLYEEAVLMS